MSDAAGAVPTGPALPRRHRPFRRATRRLQTTLKPARQATFAGREKRVVLLDGALKRSAVRNGSRIGFFMACGLAVGAGAGVALGASYRQPEVGLAFGPAVGLLIGLVAALVTGRRRA
jgi:hypothetical protein